MAKDSRRDSPPTPFAAADDEWESELAAWDAAIPIVSRPPAVSSPASVASRSAEAGGDPGLSSAGAVPAEENPFPDTPTTVVGPAQLLDLEDVPDMFAAGTFDDGLEPASGSYAAPVATDQSVPGIFDSDPPFESPPALPTETLREMSARPWTEDVASLIVLGTRRPSTSPAGGSWEILGEILAEEREARAVAEAPTRAVALLLAGARVADELGNSAEARALVDAVFEIDGSSPVAHRARFVLAERTGPLGDDAAMESLARLAFTAHPDQPYYRSLYAEWTLARVARGLSDGAAAAAVASISEGLARMLAEAELAWNEPVAAAALIESAGHRVGGGLGAALLMCAAGLNESAQNFQAAAEQRLVAARLDEQRPLPALGVLRDVARMVMPAVIPALEDLLGRLPRSPLKVSLARWGASAAVQAGDAARAWRFVAGGANLGPPTAALARDRMDLWSVRAAGEAAGSGPDVAFAPRPRAGAPGRRETLAEIAAPLLEASASPVARLCVAARMCQLAATGEDVAVALTSAEKAIAEVSNDAPVLAPAVERLAHLAHLAGDSHTRARSLRLWRDIDAARWTAASLELMDTLASRSDSPAVSFDGYAREASNPAAVDTRGATIEAILAEIAAHDAPSPAFWTVAALAAERGAFLEAAAALEQGLERPAWRASALATPLAELASELTARVDLARAAARLAAARPKQELVASPMVAEATADLGLRLTRGRVLRALGDRDLWADYVEDEIVAESADQGDVGDAYRRAALLLEPVFWRPERQGEPSTAPSTARVGDEDFPALVAAALDAVPLHPAALALALGTAPHPAILADRFAAGRSGPGGRRWLIGAAVTATVAGDPRRGLALAFEARTATPTERAGPGRHDMARAISATIRRLAWTPTHSEQRAGILRDLAEVDGTADALVEAAEATEATAAATGQADLRIEARRLFEAAAFASGDAAVAADVRLGMERLAAAQRETQGSFVGRDGKSGDRRRERDRVRLLEGATRAGRWEDVVATLVDAPAHEDKAGAEILALAAAIDEGRGAGERAREIWACARAALVFENAASSTERTAAPSRVGSSGAASSHRSPPRAHPREPTALLRAGDGPDADPAEAGAALERLAGAAMHVIDERSAALLLVEAAYLASTVDNQGETTEAQQRCLQAAVRDDPASAPAAMAWRRWLLNAGRLDEAAHAWVAEAEALVAPSARVRALVQAAVLLLTAGPESHTDGAGLVTTDRRAARVNQAALCLNRALEIDPHDHAVFTRLRDLYEETHRNDALAALLATRLAVTSNPFEITALRLARADIFADALHDRAQAKMELEAILQKEPQHARALARLADLEQEEGNDARAADLLIRRAFVERSPEKLRDLFLRLGRIYTQRLPDPKRAVGAYARVLQLDTNNREALDELSGLYAGLGETKSAISITERLVRLETIPETRARYHVRLGHLAERASDSRGAALHFRRAAEEAPRDLGALGEFVRHLEKIRDTAGRRAYLDRVASDLRVAVLTNPTDSSAIEALIAVLRWRGRTAAAAAAAELLAMVRSDEPPALTEQETVTGGHPDSVPAWATPPVGGRRLAALAQPSVDEETFPSAVPPSVRHLFRLLAPVLAETGKPNLALHHLERGDRLAAGQPPRDVFDAVGAELAAGRFELYVAPVSATGRATADTGASAALTVEPGKPPVIILGAALLALGPASLRFAAGRSLRLISTHLDVALAGSPEDLGIWIGSVVRQFVTDYNHPSLPSERLASRAARVAKLLPKRLRQEILPFAMESSGQLDLVALSAGIRDGANRAGLLASGSLEAALRVVLLTTGQGGGGSASRPGPLAALAGNAEAEALLTFALSDAYDDLVRALE